jgi:hypothetical protein
MQRGHCIAPLRFGGTVYGFIREKENAEVLSTADDGDVRRLLNGWFGPEEKSGGGRLAVPSSGFYGTFWCGCTQVEIS